MHDFLVRRAGEHDGRLFIELTCGDWHERLYVFSPITPLQITAEGLLSLALIPAMRSGKTLCLDEPLDSTLHQSVSTIQDILDCWNPELQHVKLNVVV